MFNKICTIYIQIDLKCVDNGVRWSKSVKVTKIGADSCVHEAGTSYESIKVEYFHASGDYERHIALP